MGHDMASRRLQLFFFYAALLLVAGITAWMFLPYLGALAFAATLAVILQPFHRHVLSLVRGRKTLASFLTTLTLIALVLAPVVVLAAQLFRESTDLYLELTSSQDAYRDNFDALVDAFVHPIFPQITVDLETFAQGAVEWLIGNVGAFFSGTVQTAFQIFLGLIALFYFLRDGDQFAKGLVSLSPLPDRYDRAIILRLKSAMNSVMKGSLLIGLLQGMLTGIGLTLFGVPNATLWGTIAAVCALVPGVGTSLVLAPAILYLFLTGQTWQGAGLLVWGAFAVGLIDNLLGPSLVGRGIKIHPLFVLFAVIGGVTMFGPAGFLFGPLLLSLLMALIDIYRTVALGGRSASSAR